jgi:hypothetical protein
MARVAAGQVASSRDLPSHATAPAGRILNSGSAFYLVDGPRIIDGQQYWQGVFDDCCRLGDCCEVGWVPQSVEDGSLAIVPFVPACPDATRQFEAVDIAGLGRVRAVACFGSSTLTLVGPVMCSQPSVDAIYELVGAPWTWLNVGIYCTLGNDFLLNGNPVFALVRDPSYQMMSPRQSILTGHFDDPHSRDCYWRQGYFGQGMELPPQELATIECRFQFVVDSRTDA